MDLLMTANSDFNFQSPTGDGDDDDFLQQLAVSLLENGGTVRKQKAKQKGSRKSNRSSSKQQICELEKQQLLIVQQLEQLSLQNQHLRDRSEVLKDIVSCIDEVQAVHEHLSSLPGQNFKNISALEKMASWNAHLQQLTHLLYEAESKVPGAVERVEAALQGYRMFMAQTMDVALAGYEGVATFLALHLHQSLPQLKVPEEQHFANVAAALQLTPEQQRQSIMANEIFNSFPQSYKPPPPSKVTPPPFLPESYYTEKHSGSQGTPLISDSNMLLENNSGNNTLPPLPPRPLVVTTPSTGSATSSSSYGDPRLAFTPPTSAPHTTLPPSTVHHPRSSNPVSTLANSPFAHSSLNLWPRPHVPVQYNIVTDSPSLSLPPQTDDLPSMPDDLLSFLNDPPASPDVPDLLPSIDLDAPPSSPADPVPPFDPYVHDASMASMASIAPPSLRHPTVSMPLATLGLNPCTTTSSSTEPPRPPSPIDLHMFDDLPQPPTDPSVEAFLSNPLSDFLMDNMSQGTSHLPTPFPDYISQNVTPDLSKPANPTLHGRSPPSHTYLPARSLAQTTDSNHVPQDTTHTTHPTQHAATLTGRFSDPAASPDMPSTFAASLAPPASRSGSIPTYYSTCPAAHVDHVAALETIEYYEQKMIFFNRRARTMFYYLNFRLLTPVQAAHAHVAAYPLLANPVALLNAIAKYSQQQSRSR